MVANLWFFCALSSAVLWGFSYALSEKVMKNDFSPLFVMVVTGFFYFAFSVGIAYFTNNLKSGFTTISENPKAMWNLVILAISYVIGAFLIYYAISIKNATAVNLIEITYPVFTLIFAYIIMREVQLNLAVAMGGILIFSGVALIYLKA